MATNPYPTLLDINQIFQRSFDESQDKIRVDAVVSLQPGELSISHTTDSIRLGDGTNYLTSSTVGSKNGLDIYVLGGNLTGSFNQSGLNLAIKAKRTIITDSPTKIPASVLTSRNTITIRVLGTSTVYFGDDTVTVANGYPKYQYEEIMMDITDSTSVSVYGICQTGETCEVASLELA